MTESVRAQAAKNVRLERKSETLTIYVRNTFILIMMRYRTTKKVPDVIVIVMFSLPGISGPSVRCVPSLAPKENDVYRHVIMYVRIYTQ